LPFEPPKLLSNSRLAVEAAEFARDGGAHALFHRGVLAAYFAHSQDIGDVEVLAEVAAQAGLDAAVLRQDLAAGTFAVRREAAEADARGLGVTAVPTYLFTGGYRVVGAQTLDHFRRALAACSG
jgi:predicted DsbA family dithiol-disulfide isomerase